MLARKLAGADTGFFKKGVETCDTKCGGGGGGGGGVGVGGLGVLSASGPIRKAQEGGTVRIRPDTKSGGCCIAEEGEEPYMKGGVATPKHPPPPPHPSYVPAS